MIRLLPNLRFELHIKSLVQDEDDSALVYYWHDLYIDLHERMPYWISQYEMLDVDLWTTEFRSTWAGELCFIVI